MKIKESLGCIFPSEAQCPVVDDTEDYWRIYYGARDEHNRSRIYYINVKKNMPHVHSFHHITPIVRLGQEGSFDEHGQIPSSIATINGVKWLYFTGVRKGLGKLFTNAIGAIRVEEEGFFKLKEQICETSCGEWFNSHLIVSDIKGLHGQQAFYCSCGVWRNDEPVYDIHMATTDDGLIWTAREDALTLGKDEGGMCSFNVYGSEAVFCVRDKEDYRGGSGSYKLHTAEWSLDGWKRTGRLLVPYEGWNSHMQCYPYIINNHLFYNGNNFGKTGIGCLVLE